MVKKIYIELGRCILCRACEVACEVFNGVSRIKVFEYRETMAMPLNCRHCEKAPCMEVCPVKALYRDDDGAVQVNPLKCIGCMLCAVVCPFGIPELDVANKIMVKCDLCADRRAKGLPPACVAACPTDALVYGEFEEIMTKKKELTVQQTIRTHLEIGKTLLIQRGV